MFTKMLFRGKQSPKTYRDPKALLLMVICQYALLVSSGIASAASMYLVFSTSNPIFIASNVAVLTAAGLSIVHLVLHQCGAWKYHCSQWRPASGRVISLLGWGRIVNIFAASVWIAAAVLGLIVTSKSPRCTQGSVDALNIHNWTIDDCKIQKAGMAITLIAMIFSITLSCTSASAEHPFAASLAGIHLQDHHKDVILYLSTANWPGSLGPDARPSFDTSIYTPSFKEPVIAQQPWPSGLDLGEDAHPSDSLHTVTLEDNLFLRHKESNLLPSPGIAQTPQGPSPLQSRRGGLPPGRSLTINTATSSIYSQPTDATLSYSKYASSMSSLNDNSSIWSLGRSPPPPPKTPWRKPSVPTIPQQYLSMPPHAALCTDKPPARPSPPPTHLPSVRFLECAESLQQQSHDRRKEDVTPPPATTLARPRRHTDYSPQQSIVRLSSGKWISKPPPLDRNPDPTTNVDRAEKKSHQNTHKGRSMDITIPSTWI